MFDFRLLDLVFLLAECFVAAAAAFAGVLLVETESASDSSTELPPVSTVLQPSCFTGKCPLTEVDGPGLERAASGLFAVSFGVLCSRGADGPGVPGFGGLAAATDGASDAVSLFALLLPSSFECLMSHSFLSLVTGRLEQVPVDPAALGVGLAAFSGSTGAGFDVVTKGGGLGVVAGGGHGTVGLDVDVGTEAGCVIGGLTLLVMMVLVVVVVAVVVVTGNAPGSDFSDDGELLVFGTLCLPLCFPY